MKGGRNGRLWFHLVSQLALHVRFSNESHEVSMGQEPAPTETSRPVHWPRRVWSFGKFRGLPSLATSLIGFGPTVLCYTFLGYSQSECPIGTLFALAIMRIVVIMRLTILATIAIAPLFVILRTMATNSCTSPRSHIGTSIIPSPTTMTADPCKYMFLLLFFAIHIPQEDTFLHGHQTRRTGSGRGWTPGGVSTDETRRRQAECNS